MNPQDESDFESTRGTRASDDDDSSFSEDSLSSANEGPEWNDLVLFTEVGSLAHAYLIAGVLADAGITAFVPSLNAMDEFAAVTRAFSVRVEVPRRQLAEAREVLDSFATD